MGVIDSDSEAVQYVRFQSLYRNSRGHFTGVFGLVNNLEREGRLSDEQESFRRRNNSWYDAAYADPSPVDPDVYDDEINPAAAAWFNSQPLISSLASPAIWRFCPRTGSAAGSCVPQPRDGSSTRTTCNRGRATCTCRRTA